MVADVAEEVAEPFGPYDFVYLVFVHPRAVHPAQVMEGQPRAQRRPALGGVAVTGWPKDPAGEVRPPQPAASFRAEQHTVAGPVDQRRPPLDQIRRQVDRP